MTNHKYFVKITPLNTFFFGGEKTFNTVTDEINYFASSNKWPQQTTILGLMRYLIGKGCDFAPDKIGSHSFIANLDEGYGIIKNISPVFITSKEKGGKVKYWLEAGTDFQKSKDKNVLQKITFKPLIKEKPGDEECYGVYSSGLNSKNSIPNLKFDYKEYLIQTLFDYSEQDKIVDIDSFYSTQLQVGNRKNYEGSTEEEAFFKQKFYLFKRNIAFGVFLETSEEIPFKSKTGMMGADQSLFRVEFNEPQESIFKEIENQNLILTDANRLVLLSDAYVDFEILIKCSFSISNTSDFRNIITYGVETKDNKKTQDFARIGTGDSAKKSEIKLNLLQRGSVLYSDNMKAVTSLFDNNSFKNIGYNYYRLTN